MIFKGMNLCDFCFEPLNSEMVCKNCGLSHETYNIEDGLLLPGTNLLGKYIIGRVLGRGDLGATYLAYSGMMDKVVAVREYYPFCLAKRIKGEERISIVSDDNRKVFEKGANRFFEEAKTMSRFNTNRNVVSVYEFFYANDTVYYSMEYLEGIDLKGYIAKKGGKLSEAEAVTIMRGICDGLVAVHSTQTLHRDISPNNIFVCANGDVKLIDFGAAKQVVKNLQELLSPVIVNQGFTPLEQYKRNGKLGVWTDIYSLGASIYYAVTGKMPTDAINRLNDSELVFDSSLNLSPQFIKIIKKCMELKSEDRYQSSIQLLEDLSELNIQSVIVGGSEYTKQFKPRNNFNAPVYGSPNTYIHKCKKCGTEFQSSGMSVPRPSYCYKCGSSVTCEENNDFSNIQGLQRPPLDNEFITVDGMDNVTQDKTPLDHSICFYSMSMDGHTGDGKRAGGSHKLIYNNDKRTVEEIHDFYGESVAGGQKVDYCLTVPSHIKFEEDLIGYIKSKKPEWEFYLKSYQPKRKPVNPPLMGQIAAFPPPKKDKDKTYDPPPLAGIPVYNPPKDFDPKDNIMPCVYGSPEQMSGIYGKKKAKKRKNWLFGLLLALGVSVCVVLLILILLNL